MKMLLPPTAATIAAIAAFQHLGQGHNFNFWQVVARNALVKDSHLEFLGWFIECRPQLLKLRDGVTHSS